MTLIKAFLAFTVIFSTSYAFSSTEDMSELDKGFIGFDAGAAYLDFRNPLAKEDEIGRAEARGYQFSLYSFKNYNTYLKNYYFIKYGLHKLISKDLIDEDFKGKTVYQHLFEVGIGLPVHLFQLKRLSLDLSFNLSTGLMKSEEVFFDFFYLNWDIASFLAFYVHKDFSLSLKAFISRNFFTFNEDGFFNKEDPVSADDVSVMQYGASLGLMYYID